MRCEKLSAQLAYGYLVRADYFTELIWARLNASCVQNKLSWVGVGVLYENKAYSACPVGAGAGAGLSLTKTTLEIKKT